MTMSRKLRKLLFRSFAMAVLAGALILLPIVTTSSETTCCNKCLERFYQCDANNIVCCQIYNACVQHCQTECQSCPDQ